MVSQSRSGAVGRARSKRSEADRKRREQIKALEQNARFFDIISNAGSPDIRHDHRNSTGFTPSGTGWGYTSKLESRSRSGERWGIGNIFYQYEEGFRHSGGKYSGQWGTRYTRIGYEGEDDWQRKINAAYWGRKDRDAEVQKIKDIHYNIQPFDENNPYFSARTGKRGAAGRAAQTQARSNEAQADWASNWNKSLGIDPNSSNALGKNIGKGGTYDWGMGGPPSTTKVQPELSQLTEGKSPDEVKKITDEYNKNQKQKTVTPEGKAILDQVAKYQGVKLNVYGQRTFGKVDTLEERKQKAVKDAEKVKGEKYTTRKDTKVQSFTTDASGTQLTWDALKLQVVYLHPEV